MTEQKILSSSEFRNSRKLMRDFGEWKKDPIEYHADKQEKLDEKIFDKNPKFLMKNEYEEIKNVLIKNFRNRVSNSSLSTGQNVDQKDLSLIHEIQDSIKDLEEQIVPDEKRRPWDRGCIEHSRQVEAVTRVMTEEINKKNPELNLDIDKIVAKAAIHDIGRAVSQEKLIHGLAGREILKELGFSQEFKTTTLSHLEAGVGPYITDINQESWENIKKDKESLKKRVAQYPLEEVIISLADMAKKGEIIDGKFYNNITDPIEGLWPSIKRRMPEGVTDDEIRGTMYVGFAQALKDHIENKFSVSFSGSEGMIEKSKNLYVKEFVQ